MSLEEYTTHDLERELKRRKQLKPTVASWDEADAELLMKLRDGIAEYIEVLYKGQSYEDYDHYIYEAAVEAYCGKEIWKWINERKS